MSTIRVNGIQDTSGNNKFLVQAWVNWDGVTNSIRASGGISSVTDNGVGDYTLNFSPAFADVNYAVVGQSADTNTGTGNFKVFTNGGFNGALTLKTTTQVRCGTMSAENTEMCVICVR